LARRGKYQGGKKKTNNQPKKKNPGERLRKPMLNLGKLDYFKYDLNELIESSDIEEEFKNTFKANLMAKARQRSISDAKEYMESVLEKEELSEETYKRLCKLLDRYTRVR
jgi:hypothetical protein